jgi:hypothetical protein
MVPLPHVRAMQFQGEELAETYDFAKRFAGKKGHVATLPEIMMARAKSPINSLVWNRYYTTASSEYFGLSRGGTPIVIVAHGHSPLHSTKSIERTYTHAGHAYEGLIPIEAFRRLESGDYGEVEVIDFSQVRRVYENDYFEYVTASQAAADPLLKARIGASWPTVIDKLLRESNREYGGSRADTLTLMSDGVYGYWHMPEKILQSHAMGHLLSTSRTSNMCVTGHGKFVSLDIKPHGDTDSMRFIGVRHGFKVENVHRGPEMLQPEHVVLPYNRTDVLPRMMVLKQFDSRWFTCVPKEGFAVDTGWPEHPIQTMVTIGSGKITSPNSHFFRYDIAEVIWGAPKDANAYYLSKVKRVVVNGEAKLEATVRYCTVTVDTTKKCVSEHELEGDFDQQMTLLEYWKSAK